MCQGKGNKKTRDKIIRRKLLLEEGGLITNRLMEISKNSVESLGFFDPQILNEYYGSNN